MNTKSIVILFTVFIFLIINVYGYFPDYGNDDKIRIWEPVANQDVLYRLYSFLISNNITNCYEFQEETSHLLLKCWSNQYVLDVSIMTRNKFKAIDMFPSYDNNIVAC